MRNGVPISVQTTHLFTRSQPDRQTAHLHMKYRMWSRILYYKIINQIDTSINILVVARNFKILMRSPVTPSIRGRCEVKMTLKQCKHVINLLLPIRFMDMLLMVNAVGVCCCIAVVVFIFGLPLFATMCASIGLESSDADRAFACNKSVWFVKLQNKTIAIAMPSTKN